MEKVSEEMKKNYRKVPRLKANLLKQPYDVDSVLHYAKPGVITSKRGVTFVHPQNKNVLSRVDVASIMVLYADV
jgi:hypothetical protein